MAHLLNHLLAGLCGGFMSCHIKLSAVCSGGFQKATCLVGTVCVDSESLSSVLINTLIYRLSAGVDMSLCDDFYC